MVGDFSSSQSDKRSLADLYKHLSTAHALCLVPKRAITATGALLQKQKHWFLNLNCLTTECNRQDATERVINSVQHHEIL